MEAGPEMSGSLVPMKRQLPSESDGSQAFAEQQSIGLHVQVQPPTSPDSLNHEHYESTPVLPTGASRQASPALSSSSSLTTLSSMLSPLGQDGTVESKPPSNKRRKLTFAEKEQKKAEKERRELEKAEQRAKREEEKQIKDEERRQKNETKEAKRREKELEKERKDQEKRLIEEEKEKKERAQSRINSFFAKPSPVSALSGQEVKPDAGNSCSESSAATKEERDSKDPVSFKSDYQRTFLPFSLGTHTSLAPISQFSWDQDAQLHVQQTLEESLQSDRNVSLEQSLEPQPQRFGRHKADANLTVRDIIKSLSLSDSETGAVNTRATTNPLDQLRSIPVKYICFTEDVRPPYIGTYTKLTPKQLLGARRNPFAKIRPDTDYSYDSEAEWEEPEEGEDLLSEGESELDSCGDSDEMDDFLDDQGTDGQVAKRKILTGDLEPVCSGLCYENSKGISLHLSGQTSELRRYRLGLLQERIELPIDPFSSSYWADSEKATKKAKGTSSSGTETARQPLQARPNFFANIQAPKSGPVDEKPSRASNSAKSSTSRLLEGQELEDFKIAVAGSEHTKIGLLAILKKQFPKVPNAVLSDTLGAVAVRIGRAQAEKRWALKDAD